MKQLKYIALCVFGFLFIKHYFPFGDYCKGLFEGLKFILFGGLFLVLFLILSIQNVIQVVRRKVKIDFKIYLIFIFFIISQLFLEKIGNKKLWTSITWSGSIQMEGKPQNGILSLYKNNTFEATHNYADFSCTFVGDFEMYKDTLYLLRNDIIIETDSLFTNRYVFNTTKTKLIPYFPKFKIIEKKKIKQISHQSLLVLSNCFQIHKATDNKR
ncbi:membrane hypothetical protein [Flavobacterium sp. 9AF]|uniref:hypothetical protein n=1 Tax=Flavobacterium sp. 9AF TaxID=2653142 RepID=UPI0012F365DC|nr:hypothetical protein [Flavobacterium sp. 9AF]VXB83473.1 membrane hypothetical protein [Flavobacterium sp. 9AF]